jgi:hypothetical protein
MQALGGLGCSFRFRFWNGSFRPKLLFDFSEIEGTICEGFANGDCSYSKVLAVSKGCGGRSIFTTPFETGLLSTLPVFELWEYHRLPRQSSPRPANVYKSNPLGRETGYREK